MSLEVKAKMVCIDNSGIGYDKQDNEFLISDFLTVGKEYYGLVVGRMFFHTTSDKGHPCMFEANLFKQVE